MTFDDTGAEPDQTFEVQPDRQGVIEYKTKWEISLLMIRMHMKICF